VRNSQVIDKKVAIKKLAIDAVKEGGTKEREIELERQNRQALTDGQMLQLERTSRKIEACESTQRRGPLLRKIDIE
jgi:rifampicin phosphotransferase